LLIDICLFYVDPDYLSFLESLKAEEIQQVTAKEPGAALESGATQLERLETRLANAGKL
jgi:hypothetical protein